MMLLLAVLYTVKQCCYLGGVYTYYCKSMNFTFQLLERDTFNILVFNHKDSVFIPGSSSGQYLGIQFYMPENSNVIYFEMTPFCSKIYRYVENTCKIKFVQSDLLRGAENNDSCKYFRFVETRFINPYMEIELYNKYDSELCVDSNFWGFYGGCDQGRYTFSVLRGNQYYDTLEALERK